MSEYTITLTIREEDGGVRVEQRSRLANEAGDNLAANVAEALSLAVRHEVKRLRKVIELAAGQRTTSPTPTLH